MSGKKNSKSAALSTPPLALLLLSNFLNSKMRNNSMIVKIAALTWKPFTIPSSSLSTGTSLLKSTLPPTPPAPLSLRYLPRVPCFLTFSWNWTSTNSLIWSSFMKTVCPSLGLRASTHSLLQSPCDADAPACKPDALALSERRCQVSRSWCCLLTAPGRGLGRL